jgi:mono/diheme cytochrome c family protein
MKFAAPALVALLLAVAARAADTPAPVRFSRDVLPILADNCFACHGPDARARKAGLRLDSREGALAVVVPGKSAESELFLRVSAAPGHKPMPPAKTNRRLTAAQVEVLRRWLDAGAPWGRHWAYETPTRPPLPAVKNTKWVRNAIDYFILERLEQEGLAPAPEAPKETLLRRVSLDLTGLPPTPAEIDAFLADTSPDAYEKAVDRLLQSPRYGERVALDWLDAARYADTNGFQNDFARTMWPWRDWVIDAFNRNQPFDRFVIEQMAGDLLPNPTLQQKIATGFLRNNRTVTEAGSIDEEWRVENAVDRVETTATVFLGLTMGCARCHDHKFDPIAQKEFYQFYAFFNSVNEKGVYTEQRGNVPPLVAVPGPADEQRLRATDIAIAEAERAVHEQEKALAERQQRWEKERKPDAQAKDASPTDWVFRCPLDGDRRFTDAAGKEGEAAYRGKGPPAWVDGPLAKALHLDGQPDAFLDAGAAVDLERTDRFSYGCWVKPQGDGAILSKMDEGAAYRGFDLLLSGGKVEVHLVHAWPDNAIKVSTTETVPQNAWAHLFVTYDGAGKAAGVAVYLNGRRFKLVVQVDRLTDTIRTEQPLRLGKRSVNLPFHGELADVRIYPRTLTAAEVQSLADAPVSHILAKPAEQRSKLQQELLARVFQERFATELRAAREKVEKLRKDRAEQEKRIPTVMIMEDLKSPRETFVLKRGRYDMPDREQKVEPGVAACLPPLPAGLPRNRLALAQWLVDPANPLTARVTVNRFWQHYFGTGLVKTAENFGIQGERPSHRDLLDWLATEFADPSPPGPLSHGGERGREEVRLHPLPSVGEGGRGVRGWDVKALQRLIVTSATYRQSSAAAPALVQRDPDNRLLARGPRFRLPAEVVRDNALSISGLLVEKVGGPSVKPYQPARLWEELAGGAGEGPYVQDKGPDLYRRSLYVYRKRTVPHPEMATFDAPSREVCQVKRARTNTPLQALELLNDVTYVEAARHLGQLMLTEGGGTPDERVAYAFRRATGRTPTADELRILLRGLERYRQTFAKDSDAARRFLRHGDSPPDTKIDPAELAAYAATAGVILNLDETVTKE